MSEKKNKDAGRINQKIPEQDGFQMAEDRILCCDKEPHFFFQEDPVRILSVLKDAAQSGELPDDSVKAAVQYRYRKLRFIPPEKIRSELAPLLCGKYAAAVLDEYRDVFACIIPELASMYDLDQRSPYHNRDVWHHTLAGLADVPPVFTLRMTMLLHDIAKPVVFILDDNGRGRFVGHPQKGAEMAYRILRRMEYPTDMVKKIVRLVRYHDVKFKRLPEDILRILAVFGREGFEELLAVRHADAAGKYEKYLTEAEQKNDEYRACADAIVAEERYFAPEDLAVGEEELKQVGFTDEFSLWYVRERLLMDAAERKIKNEKAALIRAAKESE